jgi:hypothetical protein
MRYKIKDVKKYLKVGLIIRTNGDSLGIINNGETRDIKGMIGEISNGHMYIFNNILDGSVGRVNSEDYGYDYSWQIDLRNTHAWIEFISKVDLKIEPITYGIAKWCKKYYV